MYQKNGQPAEKILRYYLQARFVRPKVRLYKTRNYYALLNACRRTKADKLPRGQIEHHFGLHLGQITRPSA